MKKTIVAFILIVLLFTFLPGCEGEADEQVPQGITKLDIAPSGVLSEIEKSGVDKICQEKFKIMINSKDISSDIALAAATKSLPDIFGCTLGTSQLDLYVSQDLLRYIPETLIQKYPTINKILKNSELVQAVKKLTGKYYIIPIIGNPPAGSIANSTALFYRGDWAKKLGFREAESTVDQLYELLKAFTTWDPDGNGLADTYGISGPIGRAHLAPWIDIGNWVEEDSGYWVPGYVSDKCIPALKFWNRLFNEKMVDPEFSLADGEELFKQDKTGVAFVDAQPYSLNKFRENFMAANPELKVFTDAVKVLPPLKTNTADQGVWLKDVVNIEGAVFSTDMDDKTLDQALSMIEFLMAEKEKKSSQTEDEDSQYPEDIQEMSKSILALYEKHAQDLNLAVQLLPTQKKYWAKENTKDVLFKLQKIITGNNVEQDYRAFKRYCLEGEDLQMVIEKVNGEIRIR